MKSVVPVQAGNGDLEVFGIGTDNTLYRDYLHGSSWQGYWARNFDNAPPLVSVAAAQAGNGDLEVFGIGTDHWLYLDYLHGSTWHGSWIQDPDNAPPLQSIALAQAGNGDLEVVGIGAGAHQNTLFMDYLSGGTWHGSWIANMDNAPPLQSVTAAQAGNGDLEVFGIGTDNILYRDYLHGSSWQGYWIVAFVVAPPVQSVALAQASNGDLELFAVGAGRAQNVLYMTYRSGATANWHVWTADFASAPPLQSVAAAQAGNGDVEVYGIGTDNTLYLNWLHDGGWQGGWYANPY
jgi:hypothetical protein